MSTDKRHVNGIQTDSGLEPPSSHQEENVAGSLQQLLVWKLHSLDHHIASVRYRALLPVRGLKRRGVVSRFYRSLSVERFRDADVVIFVKSFTLKDFILAQRIRKHRIPIVLDLCDNIFVQNYTLKYPIPPAEVFLMMARYAAVITTTGSALASLIESRLATQVPILIIPDGVETQDMAREGRRMLTGARAFDLADKLTSPGYWINGLVRVGERVQRRVMGWFSGSRNPSLLAHEFKHPLGERKRHAPLQLGAQAASDAENEQTETGRGPVKTLIWFGNSGADYGRFGLCDIVDIADPLKRLSARVNFELLVVSNNKEAYAKYIKSLPFATRYIEWDPRTIHGWIRKSDVAIVPNSRDEFAICKSANRAILALHLGVPVVATRTPALEPLRDCLTFDDWEDGVARYLTRPELVRDHLVKANAVLAKEFDVAVIAEKWMDAVRLATVRQPRQTGERKAKSVPTLVVVLHLIQDLDLAAPILKEGRKRGGLDIHVWVSKSLIEKSPRVRRMLFSLDIPFSVFPDDSVSDRIRLEFGKIGFDEVDAVLTIAETNQRVHQFPHAVTKRANAAGVRTYTMQHGFENIGLTYSDSVHPISRVKFAAKTIFIWGPVTLLHPQIRQDTKVKCVPVGCTKEAVCPRVELDALDNAACVVGIFENLHWHRYDERYAERFLADCSALAEAYPKIAFLVKPHHAGRWLTSRYQGSLPQHSNLVVADPLDPQWERYTANQLLASLDAVITTPSTVALDAARIGIPVAVVGYGLDLSIYSPLPVIDDAKQWDEFIQQVTNPASRQFLLSRAKEFSQNTLCQGNATTRILETIIRDAGENAGAGKRTDATARIPRVN